jgi:hypothetical protein
MKEPIKPYKAYKIYNINSIYDNLTIVVELQKNSQGDGNGNGY